MSIKHQFYRPRSSMAEYEPEKLGAAVRFHPRTFGGCASVRHRVQLLREQALEILNYVYPIIAEYITFSVDHWVLYLFAAFWSIFGRLPSVIFFLSVGLCAVIYLRRLLCVTIGRQVSARCPTWFLVAMLFCDFWVVASA